MSGPASHHCSASRGVQGLHSEHQGQQREALPSDVETEGIPVLPAHCENNSRQIRFAYYALAAVVRGRIPVAGWDDYDYEYIAVLARALADGSLPLSALVWDQASGWSREKIAAAQAINAYFYHEWKVAEASDDEDLHSDVANDTLYIADIFGLEDPENPFAVA